MNAQGLALIGPTAREIALTLAEQHAEARARDLISFADGIAQLYPELAARSRLVALDLLDTLAALKAERSARASIQASRDNLLTMLSDRGTMRDDTDA